MLILSAFSSIPAFLMKQKNHAKKTHGYLAPSGGITRIRFKGLQSGIRPDRTLSQWLPRYMDQDRTGRCEVNVRAGLAVAKPEKKRGS
jgi:hypothetical protein